MPRPMKHSGVEWLGDIPADWKIIQLKRFAHVNNGREVQTEIDKSEDAIPVYGSGGVFKYTTDYLYDGEAVMFGRKGTLGKPLYVNEKFWTVDTMYYLTFSDKLFAKFNYYQLCAFDWEPHITQTALPSIVASEIVSCKFAFPPPDEQQRIASFLDDKCARIDSVIEKTRASVEEYKKLKQALITRAVTKGIRPNRPMKQSGVEWLGDIPADWKITRGKNILTILDRPVKNDDGIITCFRDGEVTLRSNRREDGFTMSDKEIGYQGINVGDLVVHGMDGFAGAIGISDSRGKATPVLSVMDSSQNKRYLMYYLRCAAFCGLFLSLSTGIRIRSCDTNWNKLKNIMYLLPPLDEQKEIAQYLDEKTAAIDSLVAKKNRLAEELTSLKKSLIFEYVTGKKEVPT